MKTFKEFLEEALLASLIKGAARQVMRKNALRTIAAKTATSAEKTAANVAGKSKIKLPTQVTGFKTQRGSEYTYSRKPNSFPQTQRTAAVDPYHSTAPGSKQKSDWTVFAKPDDALNISHRFVSGDPKFTKGVPIQKQPQVGMSPLEVWNKYLEKGGKSAVHPGSKITDVKTSRPGQIGLYSSQRKELNQRVKAGLQRPSNINTLKSEIKSAKTSKITTPQKGSGGYSPNESEPQTSFNSKETGSSPISMIRRLQPRLGTGERFGISAIGLAD